MDYGKDIWKLISFLQDEGFEVVMILGEPGKILLFNFYNFFVKLKISFMKKYQIYCLYSLETKVIILIKVGLHLCQV